MGVRRGLPTARSIIHRPAMERRGLQFARPGRGHGRIAGAHQSACVVVARTADGLIRPLNANPIETKPQSRVPRRRAGMTNRMSKSMNITRGPLAAALTITACTAMFLSNTPHRALAQSFEREHIKITHPWTRATPDGARVAGGFMKVTNTGPQADRLIGGTFVAAKRVEIHEMTMEGSVMKMRELARGLEIKPGETVELKPGGFHIMFMDLTAPIKQGANLKGALVFERAGTIEVTYQIEAMGARSSQGVDHSKMKH